MKRILIKRNIIMLLLCLVCGGFWGITTNAASNLEAPTSVKAIRYSDTELCIKWSTVKKADGYIIYKYNKKTNRYKKYKVIKSKKTIKFVDEIGSHSSAKYKVSAYKNVKGKKRAGKQSYYVKARTYQQGDTKVNAGKVEAKIVGDKYFDDVGTYLAYYETVNLSAKVRPSKFSKASGKMALSKKLRWYSSNPEIAKVNKNGIVKAQAKAGRCYIYTMAHNGKRSNKVWIHVENYAKPNKETISLGAAWRDQARYGMVLEMFVNYYDTVTDIAEYFYINRPKGNETFRCMIKNGEVTMTPENYVTGEMKQKIHDFVEKFPYDVSIYVTPGFIKFTKLSGVTEETRTADMKVMFLFDKTKKDPTSYDEKHEIGENWYYGDYAGV